MSVKSLQPCKDNAFFNFSGDFDTIRPALLVEKLMEIQIRAPLVSQIMYYLAGRQQYVYQQSCVSDGKASNTWALRNCPFSLILHSLHHKSQLSSESCHLQKFSDNSATVGCISRGEETEYRAVFSDFVTW